ncbi:hypothetical protein Q5752_001920 [Cryptotrichosporon argae]
MPAKRSRVPTRPDPSTAPPTTLASPPDLSQTHNASLISASTASLPKHHAVYAAARGRVDVAVYQRGGEAIEDARWTPHEVSRLASRWAECCKAGKEVSPAAGASIWRTAALVYPCICNFVVASSAFVLPPGPQLPDAAGPSALAPFDIPTWSVGDSTTDLDPELDALEPFETAWRDGGTWAQAKAARAAALAKRAAPVTEWERRRAWWRARCAEGGYGAMWPHVPTVPIRTWPPRLTALDDAYIPPSPSSAHPFHPVLPAYLASRRRVYWLVPVHGPVLLPGYNDSVVSPAAKPWASMGFFANIELRAPMSRSQARPAPLNWTPALLAAFLDRLVQLDAYGPLHIVASGPKPDPWIDLPPPPPLAAHERTSSTFRTRVQPAPPKTTKRPPGPPAPSQLPSLTSISDTGPVPPVGATGDALGPVRPEAGDHVRIYVDADRALSLRTWLHWLELVPDAGAGASGCKVFARARLALVGTRGEVLVVA